MQQNTQSMGMNWKTKLMLFGAAVGARRMWRVAPGARSLVVSAVLLIGAYTAFHAVVQPAVVEDQRAGLEAVVVGVVPVAPPRRLGRLKHHLRVLVPGEVHDLVGRTAETRAVTDHSRAPPPSSSPRAATASSASSSRQRPVSRRSLRRSTKAFNFGCRVKPSGNAVRP